MHRQRENNWELDNLPFQVFKNNIPLKHPRLQAGGSEAATTHNLYFDNGGILKSHSNSEPVVHGDNAEATEMGGRRVYICESN